ncbi:hypothetical protein Ga0061061_11730 [Chelatococcus sambhunathii]|uniref:Uncharacterized protein n=1 Tax=Chelatococcus sambhunathii TaxID=363953 RepID=A0ABM9U9Q5_9HYPH|nr:hypothetical protein [Chelatococcus sambhunathii]CUA90980.1 hypothetical protein Ga0061061_11730 [Chelatococcus sambhunathii]
MKNPLKKPKTLGSILGTFNKTLADLDALINRNSDQISANECAILDLRAEAATLKSENEQALRVSARIKEFVS